MNKVYKIIISILFISFWLIISSYLEGFWNTLHWKYIILNLSLIFDNELWFTAKRIFFGIDLGFWLEEALNFLSYELPMESFKYIPIYFFLRRTWIKR